MQIISWNINGIRAGIRKGLWDWTNSYQPDILCFQETKAKAEQVPPSLDEPKNYYTYWNSAQRPGYSGVATFTKPKPQEIKNGFGIKKFDQEGRVLVTKYPEFTLINFYFPHSGRNLERLKFKLTFCRAVRDYLKPLVKKRKKLILCGDFNVAHQEIDLARPKDNQKNAGFRPEERAWADKYLKMGFIDTFRHFYPKKEGQYTWWSQRSGVRQRNVGWRIDYFFITPSLLPYLKKAFILPKVQGSDHCPLGIELKF